MSAWRIPHVPIVQPRFNWEDGGRGVILPTTVAQRLVSDGRKGGGIGKLKEN